MTPTMKGNLAECKNCVFKVHGARTPCPCSKSQGEVRAVATKVGCGLFLPVQDENKEDVSYRFFLFSKLFDCAFPEKSEVEYDLLFPEVLAAYFQYIDSQENDHNLSEYECIQNFLGGYGHE